MKSPSIVQRDCGRMPQSIDGRIMLPSGARLHPHAEIVLPFDYSLEQTFL